jgi:mRNA-degrading endonuclease toxin of MazEF toxin-antitoxin module
MQRGKWGEWSSIRWKIIVSNNAANRNLSCVIVVPLTRNPEQVYPMMAALTCNFGRIATQLESPPYFRHLERWLN